MVDNTPNLTLPYIYSDQAQKHITHNEALKRLDAIVQLSVLDRTLTAAPGAPDEGERHIVGNSASGDWAGKDGQVAAFQDGQWVFYPPVSGWLAWVSAEDRICAWDGAAWVGSGQGVNPAPMVGVNGTADATNRLVVKSDALLFSHDDVTPGNGSVQAKLNKSTVGGTVSLLFQDNYSSRAEIGLVGDDKLSVKTSPDGSSFVNALTIDQTNGYVAIAGTSASYPLQVHGALAGNQLVTNAQLGGFSWFGDIDGAKWSSKLGGYMLGWMSDFADSANLEGADIAYAGRTWRVKAQLRPDGYLAIASSIMAANPPTTANAANAVIDTADGGILKLSTSSAQFKTDIEPLETSRAHALLAAQPIWYRSTAQRDRRDWSWYGFIAEDVAAIDPRMVNWGYAPEDIEVVEVSDATGKRSERRPRKDAALRAQGVAYERFVVPHHLLIAELQERVEKLESRAK